MNFDQEFSAILFRNFSQREVDDATARQVEAFISDASDSLVSYVQSVGDARINGGWNFS